MRRFLLAAFFGVAFLWLINSEHIALAGIAVGGMLCFGVLSVHGYHVQKKYESLVNYHAKLNRIMPWRKRRFHQVFQDRLSGMVFYTSVKRSPSPFARRKRYTWGIELDEFLRAPGSVAAVCYESSGKTFEITRYEATDNNMILLERNRDGSWRISSLPKLHDQDMTHCCRLTDPDALDQYNGKILALLDRLERAMNEPPIGSKNSFVLTKLPRRR